MNDDAYERTCLPLRTWKIRNRSIIWPLNRDSGMWMIKEFGNLSVRDVLVRYNACKILMSLTGLAMLLAAEAVVTR